jgi:hypothetical protein
VNNNNSFNTTHIDNSININLNLCDFGKENYKLMNFDNIFGNDEGYIFLKLFEELHFKKNFTENYNILLTDLNKTTIKIIKDSEWITQTIDEVMKRIVDKTFLYLDKIKNDLNENTKDKIESEIKQFIHGKIDNFYNEHRIKLNSRIENIIYDNRHKVKQAYKLYKEKINEMDKSKLSYEKYRKNTKNKSIDKTDSDSDY